MEMAHHSTDYYQNYENHPSGSAQNAQEVHQHQHSVYEPLLQQTQQVSESGFLSSSSGADVQSDTSDPDVKPLIAPLFTNQPPGMYLESQQQSFIPSSFVNQLNNAFFSRGINISEEIQQSSYTNMSNVSGFAPPPPSINSSVQLKQVCDSGTLKEETSSSTSTTTGQSDVSDLPMLDQGTVDAVKLLTSSQPTERPRLDKKSITPDSKDGRYFERRQRNNIAAKRSRDNRKKREDSIAIRASFLEKENAMLRSQLTELREEAARLRSLVFSSSRLRSK